MKKLVIQYCRKRHLKKNSKVLCFEIGDWNLPSMKLR
jgi:hypothetical protein